MRLIGLVAVMACSGCLIPVAVGDGGDVVGTGGGGGLSVDGGGAGGGGNITSYRCALPAGQSWTQSSGELVITLSDCPAISVAATGPDGATLAASVSTAGSTANISIAEPPPGQVTITVTTSTGVTSSTIEIYEVQRPDAGFLISYPDRMDVCSEAEQYALFVTDNRRVSCSRPPRVYGPDGSYESDAFFAINSGNDVWKFAEGSVQHLSDTPSALVLDGTVVRSGVPTYRGYRPGGLAITYSDGLTEFRWDALAGAITTRRWLFPEFWGEGAVVEGDELWDQSLCHLEAGCSNSICEPIRLCSTLPWDVIGHNESTVWVTERYAPQLLSVRTVERPLPIDGQIAPVARPLPFAEIRYLKQPGRLPTFTSGGRYAVIIVDGPHRWHYRLVDERVMDSTERWLVTLAGPRTLRFIPK